MILSKEHNSDPVPFQNKRLSSHKKETAWKSLLNSEIDQSYLPHRWDNSYYSIPEVIVQAKSWASQRKIKVSEDIFDPFLSNTEIWVPMITPILSIKSLRGYT